MCGILGAVRATNSPKYFSQQGAQKALALLAHRGPNDQGLEYLQAADCEIIFGHTRLSIIDLSSGGHQPMHSLCGNFSIVFNGEIYNYRELREELIRGGKHFNTDSDTEVLLNCWQTWGVDCLKRLRGMFAFAVLDRSKSRLFCARDAFGIKPFFYEHRGSQLFFASELPALLAIRETAPKINNQRAFDYLIHGAYDDDHSTFIQGIESLPAGHWMELNLCESTKKPEVRRWWWPSTIQRFSGSFEQAAEQFRSLFIDSIKLHLRSDVPVGAALSGGLDSSAVVCGMRYIDATLPINTFSYIARGQEGDEESWVDLVNENVNAQSYKVLVSGHELANDIDDLIATQGEPFYSTSVYAQYRVFKLAKEQGVTVTLDGQGADELLAGYNGYPGPRLRSLLQQGRVGDMLQFISAYSTWPGRSKKHAVQALIAQYVPPSLHTLALKLVGRNPAPTWINRHVVEAMHLAQGNYPEKLLVNEDNPKGRYLMGTLRQSLAGGALGSLLRHGDRNSMRWAVESRVPFLNTDIAEFLLSLPEHFLISSQAETKHVMRRGLQGIVPQSILERKDKVGFATPEAAWLKQLGEKRILEWLEGSSHISLLNGQACHEEIQQIMSGTRPFSYRAWRLINLCRWAQLYNIEKD